MMGSPDYMDTICLETIKIVTSMLKVNVLSSYAIILLRNRELVASHCLYKIQETLFKVDIQF